ncbi:hypothetical protein BDZ97DRAFT_2057665 [Flammula alnicola]|nr:hypothetical protein BDZ97DRAFT_2057665 [Flammula alnicola]
MRVWGGDSDPHHSTNCNRGELDSGSRVVRLHAACLNYSSRARGTPPTVSNPSRGHALESREQVLKCARARERAGVEDGTGRGGEPGGGVGFAVRSSLQARAQASFEASGSCVLGWVTCPWAIRLLGAVVRAMSGSSLDNSETIGHCNWSVIKPINNSRYCLAWPIASTTYSYAYACGGGGDSDPPHHATNCNRGALDSERVPEVGSESSHWPRARDDGLRSESTSSDLREEIYGRIGDMGASAICHIRVGERERARSRSFRLFLRRVGEQFRVTGSKPRRVDHALKARGFTNGGFGFGLGICRALLGIMLAVVLFCGLPTGGRVAGESSTEVWASKTGLGANLRRQKHEQPREVLVKAAQTAIAKLRHVLPDSGAFLICAPIHEADNHLTARVFEGVGDGAYQNKNSMIIDGDVKFSKRLRSDIWQEVSVLLWRRQYVD